MQDIVKIHDLRVIMNRIFDHIEYRMGCHELTLQEDFYWDVREEDRYCFSKMPEDYAVGQLFDDYEFLLKILEDEEMAFPLMLIHAAPVLRYMAFHIRDADAPGMD